PTRVIRVGSASEGPSLYEPVPGKRGTYAALSYCWGQSRILTTTTSTLAQRKEGFSLNELPKTCRDAIIVARELSIPYLWIDSLCIVQDSQLDWETEAGRMCSVYQNALLTIAAVDSPDSNSGLFLTCPSRRTAKLEYLTQCVLTTRGWTLQEIILSPRILWFTASELAWECGAESACECDIVPTKEWIYQSDTRLLRTKLPHTVSSHNVNWHQSWRTLVKDFTKRDLTRATDRLPAISGLAASFKHHIGGAYLFGLWEHELERHLLWCSDSFRSSNSQVSHQPQPLGKGYAPSWSWASIPGAIWF
ncbi:HET-domain-containing protein, partial [Glonium stellatum]